MKSEWLESLVYMGRSGKLSLAAETLGKTPAALQLHLSNAQSELGFEIFELQNDLLAPTPAGKAFLREAERLLSTASQATAAAQRIASGRSGVLRLGLCEELSTMRLAKIIRDCRRQLPDIEFEISEASSSHLAIALRQHQIDVALMLPAVDQSNLVIELAWQEAWRVVLPAGHPLISRDMIYPEDLRDTDLILAHPQLSPCGHDLIRAAFDKANITPRIAALVLGRATMLTLTNAGVGATFVPGSFEISAPKDGYPTMRPFAVDAISIVSAHHATNPPGVAMQFLRVLSAHVH